MSALAGRSVLVTRAREQALELCVALAARGAKPVLLPTIEFRPLEDPAPLDEALARLADYAWLVFTSANGVRFFFERHDLVRGSGLPPALRVAAVGTSTAAAALAHGARAHVVPDEFRGDRLAACMGELAGRRVLLARADIGREAIVTELSARGAVVDHVAVYLTRPAAPDPEARRALERGLDAITFTSPSTARNLMHLLGSDAPRVVAGAVIACIGPVTGEAVRALGLEVHVQPAVHTIEALVEALADHFARAHASGRGPHHLAHRGGNGRIAT